MFRLDVAQTLRGQGHDVVRASETGQPRVDDKEILERAISEDRILITLDEHFGDWVVLPLSQHPGVIRLKVNPTTSTKVIELLLPFLSFHMNYPAASSGVSKSFTKEVNAPRGGEYHPERKFKGHLVILSSKRAKWIYTASR